MSTDTDHAHAISNANAWLKSIIEMRAAYAAYDALSNGAEAVEYDGEQYDDIDDLEQHINNAPLEVAFRSGWITPGITDRDDRMRPAEMKILLTTGGPALRMMVTLDHHGEPSGWPRLEWQDWFTPWTERPIRLDAEGDALEWFAGRFAPFGETIGEVYR